MGIRCRYIRVGSNDVESLRRDPESFVLGFDVNHLNGDPLTDRSIGIEKTWHALYYLLDRAVGPAADVISGGDPFAEDWGYGPPFFMDPEVVKRKADVLNRTPFSNLAVHYDAQAMQNEEIYPGVWDEDGEEFNLKWLRGHYEQLVTFFNVAAAAGDSMVVVLT